MRRSRQFLERQGYEVKGEVRGCDLVARRGDEPPVIVELKLRFSLALVLQGIDRLALTERVYLAVPRPERRAPRRARSPPDRPEIRKLCRRLGLGLMLVGHSRQDGRDPGGAGALPAAPGEIAGLAPGRRILAPGRRRQCRRRCRRAARHRLSPGRLALRPRARLGRADAGRRAARARRACRARRAFCSATSMAGSSGSNAAPTL